MTPTAYVSNRLVTCDPHRMTHDNPLGVIANGAVVVEDGAIVSVTSATDVPGNVKVANFGDRVITPGLIDAHTHACWTGSRHAEYTIRMAGGTYQEIAKAGGGILASHRAVAAATALDLATTLSNRLSRMAALGVTTVEVKSGYGLLPDLELRQLRAIASVANGQGGPYVVPTFLALHALPESARANAAARQAFVSNVADRLLPEVANEKLAHFVDAYIDENAFTVEEARTVFTAAKQHGLGIRMHIGQFKDVGGALLAREFGALSADHLEEIGSEGVRALADAGTVAIMLPLAAFTLKQAAPDINAFRAAGIRLAVASDANPGTAPTESLPLALAFAVRLYGLTPAEAFLGATLHAAASLGIRDRGVIAEGMKADLVAWNLPHEEAIIQPWGIAMTALVLRDGQVIAEQRRSSRV